jgi:PAS domain S-box-containing protein
MTTALSATEYRLLVEHSPVMIWRSGADAQCDYFNDVWLEYTGRPLEEEVGEGWTEGVHAEDLERCVGHYTEHFRRREAFEMEYRLRRHDGVYRWIFDRGVPFTSEAGEFAGYIGSCVDVDERRQAQAAREQRDAMQIAYARHFERWILAIVSHDIRNPLATIQIAASALAHRASDAAYVREVAERITRSARRITHLVTDLLDLSRERQGGGIPVNPGPADLDAIAHQVADELSTVATTRRVTVDCRGDASGTWDAYRIAQAVSNLLGNAVQHSPDGSPVEVNVRGENERAFLEIHNEGAIASAAAKG